MLNCFKEVAKEEGLELDNIDENLITSLESDKIKPNHLEEELRANLETIFNRIMGDNEEIEHGREYAETEICKRYIEKSRRDLLKLYHVQDTLDDLNRSNKEQHKKLDAISAEIKKVPEIIREKMSKQVDKELCFLDELDNSKVFFDITIELAEIYNEIEEDLNDIFEKLYEYILWVLL